MRNQLKCEQGLCEDAFVGVTQLCTFLPEGGATLASSRVCLPHTIPHRSYQLKLWLHSVEDQGTRGWHFPIPKASMLYHALFHKPAWQCCQESSAHRTSTGCPFLPSSSWQSCAYTAATNLELVVGLSFQVLSLPWKAALHFSSSAITSSTPKITASAVPFSNIS